MRHKKKYIHECCKGCFGNRRQLVACQTCTWTLRPNITTTAFKGLYKKTRRVASASKNEREEENQLHGIVFAEFEHSTTEATTPTLEERGLQRTSKSMHFDCWLKTLSLEIRLLLYIRSLREGIFQLYVETLSQLLP